MKTKPAIIVVATLIIGFVIRFLVNGQLTSQRYQRFVSQDHFDAFKYRMMEVIKPDAEQSRKIEPILEAYAQKAFQTLESSKEQMNELHKDLREDLEPYLDEQQIRQLDNMQNRFDRFRKDRPGPPSGRGRHRGGR